MPALLDPPTPSIPAPPPGFIPRAQAAAPTIPPPPAGFVPVSAAAKPAITPAIPPPPDRFVPVSAAPAAAPSIPTPPPGFVPSPQAHNDQIFQTAERNLLGLNPPPTLADVTQKRLDEGAAIPPTPDPNGFEPVPSVPGAVKRKMDLRPAPTYVPMNKEDFEAERGAEPGTDIAEALKYSTQSGETVYKPGKPFVDTKDGRYAVRKDVYDLMQAKRAAKPPPQQSLSQDLKNVPANVGAGVARGIGGVVGTVGGLIQSAGEPLNAEAYAPSNLDPQGNLKQPTALMRAGGAVSRQGDYLAQGAAQTEQDLPVQGAVGKLLVGAGELGVDAAMSTLVGPSGFVASFAGRSAGTMYVQARAQGDDEQTAAGKAMIAGFTAAITPQLAHILPPKVGEEIAVQVAKSYGATGSIVYAQGLANELTLKAGTTLNLDLSHLFPEAGVQGIVGVAFHGLHAKLGAHQERAANPGPARLSPERRAEAPLTRPEDQATPALQPGDYGAGLGVPPPPEGFVPVETPPTQSAAAEVTPPTAQPVSVKPVAPDQGGRNEATVFKDGERLRATVTTVENDGGYEVKRIKLHRPDGTYEVVDVPPGELQNAPTSGDAREAIFQYLESKYPPPRELPPAQDLLSPVPPEVQAEFDARGKPPAPQSGAVGTNVATDMAGVGNVEQRAGGEGEKQPVTPPTPEQRPATPNVATEKPATPEVAKEVSAGSGLSKKPWAQTPEEYLADWKNSIVDEVNRAGKLSPNGMKEATYYVPENIRETLAKMSKTPEQFADDYIQQHRAAILEGHQNEIARAVKAGRLPSPQPPAPERTAKPQTGQAPPAQRQPPGGAGLTIEPHGQGLRIVRASPKLTMLGQDWEGRRISTYNTKAGGWIFNPKNEGEVRAVMEKINSEAMPKPAAKEVKPEAAADEESPKTTYAPTEREGVARPKIPRGNRPGAIALPDFKNLLGYVRRVRERYSHIEAADSPDLASGLTQHIQSGHTAETIIRNFERKAFEGAPDKDQATEEFRSIGWNNRATLAKARGLPATQIPTLTPAQETAIRAKPYIQKAIDLWNAEIAPAMENIRLRSRLPMDPNAHKVDLFLNLPSEGSAAGGGESGVNLNPAFAKKMIGEGDYKLDPHDTLVSIVRGHLATDASRDIASAIRNRISINPATVTDPLAKRNPAVFQQPKQGSYFQAKYKGQKIDVSAVDLNTNPFKPAELHYVPRRVAEAMDQARQSTDPHDTPVDKLMHGATRLGLIGDFAPHSLRVLFQAASRVGQSGQSAASAVPWLGSIPATIVRMAKMSKTPLSEAMQILIDKSGASRGSGYNLEEPKGRIAKLADVSHRVLMDPETGIDPRARRVVADAHLRMELGNKFMDGLEKELDAGTTTPAEAADQVQQKLKSAGMQSLGRRVNATLGFSTKQTRSNVINNLQRWLPFLSSESGMIPDEIRKVLTLNLNPKAILQNIDRREYATAALQMATQLTTGAIGTYLARQALNYAFSGHAMDQNDEGRKLDVQIAKGWYLGNLDPTFDRAARLLGLRDRANYKEPHVGREAVNESLAVMNPAIRMAVSAMTGATPYIQDDRKLMAARAGWWWPTGFLRNTVQSAGEGRGAAQGFAQDLTTFFTGARLTPSSGKNYTGAERLAHEIAGRRAQELSPEERVKHDARHELISQLRANPDKRSTLLQDAIKAGTIGRSDASTTLREAQLNDFQNTVRRLELPDAVKVWEKATPAEREKLRTIMFKKVQDSRDVEQRRRALLVLRDG